MTSAQDGENFILCKKGDCRTVTSEEFLKEAFSYKEYKEEQQVKPKKPKKKKKKKKEIIRPKPGEDTVLIDHQQMKHSSLPGM